MAPTGAISADGTTLNGTAEAGATVGVDTNGDGTADVTAVADASGNYSVTLNPPVYSGASVGVSATDAAGNAGVNGNDLDYEDFLFRFTGVACVGAGQSCTVATEQGACQIGVTECDAAGKIFCKSVVKAGVNKETCDGVDNDCNGQVDDGATCPIGQLCSKGRCSDPCGSEALCPVGQECQLGRCIDSACVGKTCAANQVCRGGSCVSPCDGIKCPSPYICSGGLCIDPCVGVSCGQGKICHTGNGGR